MSTPTVSPQVHGPEIETVYRPRGPLDLRGTLSPHRRGSGDPCIRLDEGGGVWIALRTAGESPGVATLLLTPVSGEVRVRAWGSGASVAVSMVPELLGEGDDWAELDTSGHPLLADSARRNQGLRLTRSGRVLDALAPAVIEQRVTSVEAFRAWRILLTRYGEVAPGPLGTHVSEGRARPAFGHVPLRLPLTPEQWRRIPSWEWHRAGVDPGRSRTVLLAAQVASGLERTLALGRGGDEVWRRLRTVNGVGVWTAAETAQRAHGDPDAVSFGDYHLAATIGWALVGEPIDDDALAELLEPWRGQRQRVVRLVLASGFRPPRHGPRMTIQDHRGY
ncbi:DNA-3-methyladenine glycosylase 2 family protein [Herbiconiux sp. CPCC 205716]|uniref:DNA-3-methyladenine glycosylase 2 family protein n=1 Tax=Herbiconiux gentiana TaxID=2970912 RepID=A0ABT2GBC2_9MICO|nr:DNA-3-methyladenine glycosylase 2 family protein [Herbiconiux gentiana]MCS5713406.1 DNA-3-methyladenine glycosylase 2 family protein [Herbiconiux gentiana]